MTLPSGYTWIEHGRVRAFSIAETREWVEEAISRSSLYEFAAERSRKTLQGRGPVHVVSVAGRDRVVRRYRRGGLPARVVHDRFIRLGSTRPIRELRASESARRAGIPTPRVTAGAMYREGIFYRADLVTDYVPGSRTLADIVFDDASRGERAEALRATGELTKHMATIGFRHPDLNAKNILLRHTPEGWEALLVDLDRCSVPLGARSISAEPMLARLTRSLHKIARTTASEAPTGDLLDILRDAARSRVGG